MKKTMQETMGANEIFKSLCKVEVSLDSSKIEKAVNSLEKNLGKYPNISEGYFADDLRYVANESKIIVDKINELLRNIQNLCDEFQTSNDL